MALLNEWQRMNKKSNYSYLASLRAQKKRATAAAAAKKARAAKIENFRTAPERAFKSLWNRISRRRK